MQEEGWIKLYRVIKKNWIWEDPQKLKWWLDILLSANHQERKILLGNELVVIEKGSFHTSEVKLMKRWQTTKTTTRNFLELLERDHMITTVRSKKGTTVKVSNYNDYQAISEDKKTIKEPQKNHTVYTNKNEKNYKNYKEGEERKEEVPILPPLSFPTDTHKLIFKEIGEIGYRTWFMDSIIEESDKQIEISVPKQFKRNAIRDNYAWKLGVITGKQIIVKDGGA